jgi:type III pantothenate kinase
MGLPLLEDQQKTPERQAFVQWLQAAPVSRSLGVCVAPPARRTALEQLLQRAGLPLPLWQTAQTMTLGLRNGYDAPEQLGADRWMAALGGWSQRDRITTAGLLLVHAGTATTVDALDLRAGNFLGGLILPGLALMKQSLLQATALLRQTDGLAQTIPTNTAAAIHTGCLRAQTGAIRTQADRLARQLNAPITLWLAGGQASVLWNALSDPAESWPSQWPKARYDNLVLEGLATLARQAKAS